MQAKLTGVLAGALAGVLAATLPVWAQEAEAPLSAIDWLSDSIATPPETPDTGGDVATSATPGAIDVTPLGGPIADAAGLLPPSATGLPRDLWGPAGTEDIVAALDAVPETPLPSLRNLLITLLLAEANAPSDSGKDDRLLLARVDRLLETGALDRAAALLERAGAETPERFRRYFDIALLQGTETEACERMLARPDISPTYPARIFCLARGGDWQAAAVTLETANSLGILSPAEDLLLARFLDSEIIDEGLIAPDNRPPSPLMFRMSEAVGEPIPTTTLPLPYAWADLRDTRGWKAQIEAGERLARHGVLSGNRLVGHYLRQRPSASGGVWERVAAIQQLQVDLAEGNAEKIDRDLSSVWIEMRDAGLHHVFAAQYGKELAALPLSGPAATLALRIGLRSPAYEEVALAARAEDVQLRFLLALARGVPETAVAPGTMSLSVRQGFAADAPPPALQRYVASGRVGEAILKALTLFNEGAAGDPDGISDAIALLRSLGLESTARRAALELLLQEGYG